MPPKTSTLESALVEILEEFERQVDGVRGSAVADREGLPIVNGFREPFDLGAVTAMSTLAADSSQKVFDEIGLGAMRTAFLEGDDAKVVIFSLGSGRASLIAVVRSDVNVGLLRLQMALAARRIEEELGFVPRSGPRIEELFLLTKAGLAIGHRSRAPGSSKDGDILAGMLTAVQSFVKDAFGDAGGTLEEMEMARWRVRIIRGRWCAWAVIASGPIGAAFVGRAKESLASFEARNGATLATWNGDLGLLEAANDLLDDLFHARLV